MFVILRGRLVFRRLSDASDQIDKSLMQIAPPTRENVEAYSDIREELEKLSGAINGEFAQVSVVPHPAGGLLSLQEE